MMRTVNVNCNMLYEKVCLVKKKYNTTSLNKTGWAKVMVCPSLVDNTKSEINISIEMIKNINSTFGVKINK